MFWIVGGQEWASAIARPVCRSIAAFGRCRQFEHVEWEGFVAWDLIMPLFLFVVGVAMPFSFARRVEQGEIKDRQLVQKIVRRIAGRAVRAGDGGAGQFAGVQSRDASSVLQHAAGDRRGIFCIRAADALQRGAVSGGICAAAMLLGFGPW